MGGLDWRPLHGIDRGRFGEGRLQAHCAVQWLARAARAYIPPLTDDSHTNMVLGRRARRLHDASPEGRVAAGLADRRSDAGIFRRWRRERASLSLERPFPCAGAGVARA